MIISTKQLKDTCSKVLTAVESNSLSTITETLELLAKNGYLNINITNKEYYVRIKLPMEEQAEFHATVNAVLFLKLIFQTTKETVELNIKDNTLEVIGNGNYTLPLIYENDKLLELPEININNVTNQFTMSTGILKSILVYNSKELTMGVATRPVQKLYYIDSKGCLTFTTGACVNSFTLPEDIKILVNNRIVKLFSLFDTDEVNFTLGQDSLSDGSVQTKICISNDYISLTAILSNDESLLSSVPVEAIRGRSNDDYPYSISISKNELLQTLNRMLLFFTSSSSNICYSKFVFGKEQVVIKDTDRNNEEIIKYSNTVLDELDGSTYECLLDLNDIKNVISNFNDSFININFGNEQAIVVCSGSIRNVVPECSVD